MFGEVLCNSSDFTQPLEVEHEVPLIHPNVQQDPPKSTVEDLLSVPGGWPAERTPIDSDGVDPSMHPITSTVVEDESIEEINKSANSLVNTFSDYLSYWRSRDIKELNLDTQDDDLDNLSGPIPKVAGKLAALCRMELPLTHTVANELVAKEWLHRYMLSVNFRKTDIARILPFAVKLCFVPTRFEMAARNYTLSKDYQVRYEIENSRLQKRRTWLQWLLGYKKVVEPRPNQA